MPQRQGFSGPGTSTWWNCPMGGAVIISSGSQLPTNSKGIVVIFPHKAVKNKPKSTLQRTRSVIKIKDDNSENLKSLGNAVLEWEVQHEKIKAQTWRSATSILLKETPWSMRLCDYRPWIHTDMATTVHVLKGVQPYFRTKWEWSLPITSWDSEHVPNPTNQNEAGTHPP